MPYTTLTIDIETVAGRPEDAERDMRMNWSPTPNWKPDTIGKRYLEMLDKKKERLALIDGSRVISAAVLGVNEFGARSIGCFHSLYAHEPHRMESADIYGFATEREMLIALRTVFDTQCGPEACLVGHNVIEFDLPKLRMAYLRNGLNLPGALADQSQPVFDTMREWGKRFSSNRNPFVSVADVLEVLGMDSHKGVIDGSQVEQLYAASKHDTIIKYNLLDVIAEHDLFLRMTGQSGDREGAGEKSGTVPDGAPVGGTQQPQQTPAPAA